MDSTGQWSVRYQDINTFKIQATQRLPHSGCVYGPGEPAPAAVVAELVRTASEWHNILLTIII